MQLAVSGGTALLVYALLWALTPGSATEKAPVRRLVDWLSRVTKAAEEEPRVERRVCGNSVKAAPSPSGRGLG